MVQSIRYDTLFNIKGGYYCTQPSDVQILQRERESTGKEAEPAGKKICAATADFGDEVVEMSPERKPKVKREKVLIKNRKAGLGSKNRYVVVWACNTALTTAWAFIADH